MSDQQVSADFDTSIEKAPEGGLPFASAQKIRRKAAQPRAGTVFASGRRAALHALDCLLAQEGNIQKLYDAMQERLDVDAVGFMKEVVMPMTPKRLIDGTDEVADGSATTTRKVVVILPDNRRDTNVPDVTT